VLFRSLQASNVDPDDIERYLGVIEARVRSGQTGASWILKSFTEVRPSQTPEMSCRTLTESMLENQRSEKPVHQWPSVLTYKLKNRTNHYRKVEQFMSTDLFTVRPDDLVDLAASIMDWERIRHIPVEDDHGNLVGLISHRDLLHMLVSRDFIQKGPVPVFAIMKKDPITVTPDTSTLEAINLMRTNRIGCLPVVRNQRLVGIITVYDLLAISSRLLVDALGDLNETD